MIRIREVRLDDAEAIQRINSDSLQYDFPVEDTRNQLAKIMRSPHAVLLVAEDDADVLGYIQLSDYENTYHHSLKNLITLATSPKYQRMGVGARLLQAGEEWAKANGAKGIRLVSGESRVEAQRFYAAHGYAVRKTQTNLIKWWD